MSKDIRKLVGDNVRRLRVAAGLTQAKLSAEMDRDRSYVSGLELGQRNPTILTLWHLAQALRAHPKAFFEEGQGQEPGKDGTNTPRRAARAGIRGAGGSPKAARAKKGRARALKP
jgi:transcriptional regulator with XRE-family HTH domain